MGFFLVTVSGGYSLAVVCGRLMLWSTGCGARGLSSCSSRAPEHRLNSCGAHGLSRSAACGIFLAQGSNPCLLHGQEDSVPLSHQGNHFFLLSNVVLLSLCVSEGCFSLTPR